MSDTGNADPKRPEADPYEPRGPGYGLIRKPGKIEVPTDDPFEFDKVGGRRELAEAYTSLLPMAVRESIVISLDAPWGSGKTTFLEMWRGR
jgi:KAP family P-loop domain